MANSELRTQIINLGKALAEELKLNPGVDTLSRWMVHYIAEQMTVAENAIGDKKRIAEQRCFETILKLWQHRSSLPNGHRPFESFEPIFRALARLDPDNPTPYFFSEQTISSSETNKKNDDSNNVHQLLEIATGIDRGTRAMLEFIFNQAALSATDAKTIMWLNNAVRIPPNEDVSIIVQVLSDNADNEDEATFEKQKLSRQEKIKSRIEQLETLIVFGQEVRAIYLDSLNTLIKESHASDENDNTNP